MDLIQLSQLLELQQAHIFVAGDIILDEYLFGESQRLSPEAPVPVVVENHRNFILGGSANVAANISDLGAHVTLCGRLGTDVEAQHVKNLCSKLKIETMVVHSHACPTTIKTRIFAGKQQIVRIDKEKTLPLSLEEEGAVLEKFRSFCKKFEKSALVISDYAKGFFSPGLLRNLMDCASEFGIPVLVDPKNSDFSVYARATLIKPNLSEGRAQMREPRKFETFEDELFYICSTIQNRGNFTNVVLSLSENGVALFDKNREKLTHYKSRVRQVSDVSGAGDTMLAVLALGLAIGLNIENTLLLANIASGLVCEKLGTATISFPELLEGIKHYSHLSFYSKITDTNSVVELTRRIKSEGKKVVFTNGCFDILHAGHAQLLQQAKSLGDVLVVGVNTDDSITRLKGPSRPVQKQSDRGYLLASMQCVDSVVFFDQDTPLELIQKIKPDFLVKGGDYRMDQIVGWDFVKSYGGKVITFPLLENRSTTNIISKFTGEKPL